MTIGEILLRWTDLRNAGMLPIGMTPPANNAQSDARYIVASLKHVVRDIQEEFGRGSVHNMVISLEPNEKKNGNRRDSHVRLSAYYRQTQKQRYISCIFWSFGSFPCFPVAKKKLHASSDISNR